MECGYQCEVEGPVPQGLDITCSVCLGIFRNPHLLGCCGHHLCEACLSKVQSRSNLCPLCQRTFVQSMLDLGFERRLWELTVSCVFKEAGCNWKGELRCLDSHVTDNCDHVPVTCPWECGEKVLKLVLEEHKLSLCPKRPWYICFKDADLRSLAEKVDVLGKEKNALASEVCEVKQQLSRVEQEKEALSSEIDELREAHSSGMQEMRELVQSLTQELNKLKTAKNSTASKPDLNSQTSTEEAVLCSSSPVEPSVPVAPTTFTVGEVNRRKKYGAEWFSPYFLSHAKGYQLQLRVDCGGVMEGKGSHLSVYMYIAKGEHDRSLKWPFEGSVTVRLLNRDGAGQYHEKIVDFPKSLSSAVSGCVKEGLRARRGHGFAQYLPLVDLGPYLQENSLTFEVLVNTVNQTGLLSKLFSRKVSQ